MRDISPPKRKIDWWIVVILLVGLLFFIWKLHIVRPIQYIGHAEQAGYALMADGIIKGRGLTVDYIGAYFLKYPRDFSHTEEHWPPLYSFFIVPFFLVLGKSAFAAKLPALIISCLLFPLAGYFLGRRLSQSKAVGLATALNLLVYPPFFTHSLLSSLNLYWKC